MNILRNNTLIASVQIDNTTIYTEVKMGAKKIDANFYTSEKLDIRIGDYVEFEEEKYYINNIPKITEITTTRYYYTLILEGEIYLLNNRKLRDEGDSDFSYFGDAELHLQLLVDNMNVISSGWIIGEVAISEPKTIVYSSQSCHQALVTIANEFDLEFELIGRTTFLKDSIAVPTEYTFEYGRRKGLYQLTQRPVDDNGVITRWYGYGASKNIDADYRDGKSKLIFEEEYIDVDVDIYGIREGDYINEDIYPKRTSIISGIDADSSLKVTDLTLDFDINDYLIENVTAQIVFKTGELAGNEFDITSYNASTQEITFATLELDNDYTLPNDTRKPNMGDYYTLVGISMPEQYIIDAEAELKEKTIAHAEENRSPVVYDLDIDPKHISRNNIALKAGYQVTVKSNNLGVEQLIEVNEIKKPIIDPNDITVVLSDTTVISESTKNLIALKETPKKIEASERSAVEIARQKVISAKQKLAGMKLMGVFDEAVEYYNTNHRTDVVKYDDKFWFYTGVNKVAGVWNYSNWQEFQESYKSIGTELLLAENATIGDWIHKEGTISSENDSIVLDADLESIFMSGIGSIYFEGLLNERGYSRLNADGLSIETDGGDFRTPASQGFSTWRSGNATILEGDLSDTDAGNLLAAVYGKATNESLTPSRTFGGYFVRLMARGFYQKYRVNSTELNYEMWVTDDNESKDSNIIFNKVNNAVVKLPAVTNSHRGCIATIHSDDSITTLIDGNGKNINHAAAQVTLASKESITLMYISENSTGWVVQD